MPDVKRIFGAFFDQYAPDIYDVPEAADAFAEALARYDRARRNEDINSMLRTRTGASHA